MPAFSRSPFFKLNQDKTISVRLPTELRDVLAQLADELGDAIEEDSQDLRRLFPTAYPQSPERDAGYQIFSRDQLIETRHQRITVMRDTAQAERLSTNELSAWMTVINDIRLVLGTKLDVSEGTNLHSFDPHHYDDPERAFNEMALYESLGELLDHIVSALTGTLKPDRNDTA